MVSFHLLRAPFDLGKKTSFFLPQIRGTLLPTSGRALFVFFFHALRAPIDLSKKTSSSLPQIRGTLQPTSGGRCLFSLNTLRARCDLGKKTSCSRPHIRGTLQPTSSGALFAFSFHALRAPLDLGKKKSLFPDPKFKAPCSRHQSGVVCSYLFFFHALRAPRDISPSSLIGDCPLASADRVAISILPTPTRNSSLSFSAFACSLRLAFAGFGAFASRLLHQGPWSGQRLQHRPWPPDQRREKKGAFFGD